VQKSAVQTFEGFDVCVKGKEVKNCEEGSAENFVRVKNN